MQRTSSKREAIELKSIVGFPISFNVIETIVVIAIVVRQDNGDYQEVHQEESRTTGN